MNKNTQNKLRMYKTVSDTVKANGTIWEGIPAFVSTVEEFDTLIRLLEEKDNFQKNVATGIGLVSNHNKKVLFDKIVRISGAMRAFASRTGNEKLLIDIGFPSSSAFYSSRVNFMGKVNIVVEKANEYSNELEHYGISAADISEINSIREELETTLKSPRKAILERKNANSEMVSIEKRIDFLLKNSIDALMLTVKEMYPIFFNKYSNARVIIAYGNKPSNDNAA